MLTIFEASRLNPGKKMILGSLLGSKGAAELVKTSTVALKQWPKLDKKQKASFYEKLKELKDIAKQTLSADLKNANPVKKKAAREKAVVISQKFAAAVKKREGSSDAKPDISKLEQKRDELKDWLLGAQAEMEKEGEGKSDEEAAKIGDKYIALALKKADEYNKIIQQIEDANKSNEAFNILVESFIALLEFDADKVVDKIKDAAEELKGGSDKSDSEDDSDEDGDYDEKLKEELAELKADYKDKKEEWLDYRKELDLINSEIYKAKKAGDDDEVDSLESHRDHLKQELEDAQDELDDMKADIERLESELSESRVIMTFESFVNNKYKN